MLMSLDVDEALEWQEWGWGGMIPCPGCSLLAAVQCRDVSIARLRVIETCHCK